MFLSREIYIKRCQIYREIYIYIKFCIKIVGFNKSYSANAQLKNLLEFNNFSFLIDII